MIDYSLVKLMHRHDGGWAALEPVDDEDPGSHHDAAAHDPERSVGDWVRRYRCQACGEEFGMAGTDPQSEPDR